MTDEFSYQRRSKQIMLQCPLVSCATTKATNVDGSVLFVSVEALGLLLRKDTYLQRPTSLGPWLSFLQVHNQP